MNDEKLKSEYEWYKFMAEGAEYRLPLADAVARYIVYGTGTGGFLQAVFSNNLVEASYRADSSNVKALGNYGRYLQHHAPVSCYGSEDEMDNWRGLQGLEDDLLGG